jgi:hydroxymethylbilane synthase
MPIDMMLPAPSQGAVGIEALAANRAVAEALAAINDRDTFDCVMLERAVLAGLGGTCHSPIAALALVEGDSLFLRAEIISPDGSETVREEGRLARGDGDGARAFGRTLLDRASPGLRALFEG